MTWWEIILAIAVGLPVSVFSLILFSYSVSYGWTAGRIKAIEVSFLKKLSQTQETESTDRTRKDE